MKNQKIIMILLTFTMFVGFGCDSGSSVSADVAQKVRDIVRGKVNESSNKRPVYLSPEAWKCVAEHAVSVEEGNKPGSYKACTNSKYDGLRFKFVDAIEEDGCDSALDSIDDIEDNFKGSGACVNITI